MGKRRRSLVIWLKELKAYFILFYFNFRKKRIRILENQINLRVLFL